MKYRISATVFLLLCAAVAILLPTKNAISETPASSYVPIGVSPGSGGTSNAWFIDSSTKRIIYCSGIIYDGQKSNIQCLSKNIP